MIMIFIDFKVRKKFVKFWMIKFDLDCWIGIDG